MFAWDSHLNQSVVVRNVILNGEVYTIFNSFNITDQSFFLELSNPRLGEQLYAFNYVALCVFPTSGLYCPLNRWLFYIEVGVG